MPSCAAREGHTSQSEVSSTHSMTQLPLPHHHCTHLVRKNQKYGRMLSYLQMHDLLPSTIIRSHGCNSGFLQLAMLHLSICCCEQLSSGAEPRVRFVLFAPVPLSPQGWKWSRKCSRDGYKSSDVDTKHTTVHAKVFRDSQCTQKSYVYFARVRLLCRLERRVAVALKYKPLVQFHNRNCSHAISRESK